LVLGIALAAVPLERARALDFETGLKAFDSGDYAEAFENWWTMARKGDAKSQASLGFLYYAGKGVRRDD